MSSKTASAAEPSARPSHRARRRFLGLAGLFLAGPAIWAVHFFAVYLLAEWVCARTTETPFLDETVVVVFTLVTTALAASAVGLNGYRAYRRWRPDGEHAAEGASDRSGEADRGLAFGGLILSALFAIAILYVGLPAAVLAPC